MKRFFGFLLLCALVGTLRVDASMEADATGRFYGEFGMGVLFARMDSNEQALAGISYVFGARVNDFNRVHLEYVSGMWARSDGGHWKEAHGLTGYSLRELLVEWSFCVPLGERWELRISPAAGVNALSVDDSWSDYFEDWDWSFVWGGGLGISGKLGKKLFLDFGYRYLRGNGEWKFGSERLDFKGTHYIKIGARLRF